MSCTFHYSAINSVDKSSDVSILPHVLRSLHTRCSDTNSQVSPAGESIAPRVRPGYETVAARALRLLIRHYASAGCN